MARSLDARLSEIEAHVGERVRDRDRPHYRSGILDMSRRADDTHWTLNGGRHFPELTGRRVTDVELVEVYEYLDREYGPARPDVITEFQVVFHSLDPERVRMIEEGPPA